MNVTTTTADPTREALRRARDEFAHAVPTTPHEHIQHMLAVCGWLGDWADELGAVALDDLANRLRPLRKEGIR